MRSSKTEIDVRNHVCAATCLCVVVACMFARGQVMAQTSGANAATRQSPATTRAATPANAQTSAQAPQTGEAAGQQQATASGEAKEPRGSDRRKAAKLYLAAGKLFVKSRFEEAEKEYEKAAALDPANKDYRMAAEVARGHEVTALIQAAAKDRLTGNDATARAALQHALEIDPKNFEASQHLDELADEAVRDQQKDLYEGKSGELTATPQLLAAPGKHSFHLHADARQTIEQVFQAYGVKAMLDDSVRPMPVRIDLDDVTFEEAARIACMVAKVFFVPLDAHHAIVAGDTRENRQRFTREELETMYLTGLNDDELKDVENVAKNVFEITQASTSPSARTITLRAPPSTLHAFNSTMQSLLDGRSQVVIDVNIIQVAHTGERNTGAQFPQTFTAFNLAAEEQSILNQNQSLVQQIISSGLASPSNPLAILGILIASGQVSSSLFSNGFALFGGGLTESALTLGSTTVNLNLNTSDSRELDQIQFRLQDGEKGTLKEGSRYPIQTSSYSSLSPSLPNIPGLSSAGTSGNLSSLLSSLSSTVPNVPMVQYEDLGLTLTTTPKVLRNNDIALDIDMKLDALAGTSINGNPVLDNRAYKADVILKEGGAAVVATEVDKSQSLAISGTPAISEIPGMNDLTGKDYQKNYATIVIVMTPHVVRGSQAAGHTAMMRVEKSSR
jgi:general secretion pathway protein D